MRKVKLAALQFSCTQEAKENIAKADQMAREAAAQGAQVILLPELFERPYFCQERKYGYYHYAKPVMENEAVLHFRELAKELQLVIPVSFYEREGNLLFNSVAMIDAGEVRGV